MTIAERIGVVRARIDAAAPDPIAVTLVAVSKTVDAERARAAIDAGLRDLGENRAQEFLAKKLALGVPARWHFIGTLQRNKVRDVTGEVALIHSIDSVELARAVGARATELGILQDVLLQVNTSGETTKHGVTIADASGLAAELSDVPGVRLRGFMTIPAAGDPEAVRSSFRGMRELRDRVGSEIPEVTELSMGMSADFDIAVEEGATIVRIGSAIFGSRPDQHSGRDPHEGSKNPG